MSLKNVHVIFIALCAALSVFFSLWALSQFRSGGSVGVALAGFASLGAGALLVRYAWVFLRRCRQMGIQ